MPASRSDFHRSSTWRGVEAELGLVAAAVLPLAGAQRGQAHAHAQARLHAQRARLLRCTSCELGRLLDDDEGLQAQLAADQRQADVLAVLVAVADDQPARPRQRQHRHQLGLAAGFQAEALACVRCQRAGHAAMLVDLDRIHRGVAAGVVPVLHAPARTRPAACRGGRRGCPGSAPAAAACRPAPARASTTSGSGMTGPLAPFGRTTMRPAASTSK